MNYLLGLLPIVLTFAYYGGDSYWPAWFVMSLFGVLAAASLVYRKTSILPALLFLWIGLNAVITFGWKPATEGVDLQQTLILKTLSEQAFIEFLLVSGVFLCHWRSLRRPLAWGFYVIGLTHVLCLFTDQAILHIPSGKAYIGLLGNRSIGASFAVCWFFFVLHMFDKKTDISDKQFPNKLLWWSAWLAVPAIAVSSSAISMAALTVGLFVWAAPSAWWFALTVLTFGAGLSYYVKPDWFNNTRFEAWPIFWNFYRENFNPLFGSGHGTFKFWGPVSQAMVHYRPDIFWLWVHNDWLQTYFELGAIGFALAFLNYFSLLVRASIRPYLFSGLVATGVVMLGNYPFRQAPFMLLVAWIFAEAYFEEIPY